MQLTRDTRPILGADWSPDGSSLVFHNRVGEPDFIWRAPIDGGNAVALSSIGGLVSRWSPDGESVYFIEWTSNQRDIWEVSFDGDRQRRLTDLRGRDGILGTEALASDGTYVYFTWRLSFGDIWVMDVVTDED